MKKLFVAIFAFISIQGKAQVHGEIAIDGTFGNMVLHSPKITGSYEGIEIAYRQTFTYFGHNYWEIQTFNTDLTRLHWGRDTTSRGQFKPEYGLMGGVGIKVIGNDKFRITIVPQIGLSYSNQFNPIARGILRVNWGIVELSGGVQYRIPWSRMYPGRPWIGLGVTQKL